MESNCLLRTLLVMSAYRGDGRTTTVLNLGIALAEGGGSVLLADADLRHPDLGQLLGAETAVYPLQQLLTDGQVSPDLDRPIGLSTSVANIRVLPAEPVPRGQPIPPLSSLMEHLSVENGTDYIILDSPACLQYADAFQLAPLVDGVIYVIRKRRQDHEAQRRVRAQLDRVGANLLGLVFNQK